MFIAMNRFRVARGASRRPSRRSGGAATRSSTACRASGSSTCCAGRRPRPRRSSPRTPSGSRARRSRPGRARRRSPRRTRRRARRRAPTWATPSFEGFEVISVETRALDARHIGAQATSRRCPAGTDRRARRDAAARRTRGLPRGSDERAAPGASWRIPCFAVSSRRLDRRARSLRRALPPAPSASRSTSSSTTVSSAATATWRSPRSRGDLKFQITLNASLGAGADLHELYFNLGGSSAGLAISSTDVVNTAYSLLDEPVRGGRRGLVLRVRRQLRQRRRRARQRRR